MFKSFHYVVVIKGIPSIFNKSASIDYCKKQITLEYFEDDSYSVGDFNDEMIFLDRIDFKSNVIKSEKFKIDKLLSNVINYDYDNSNFLTRKLVFSYA